MAVALMALAGTAKATIAYDSSLKCGQCIKGGFNYCFQGNDTQAMAESQLVDFCCQDTSSNCRQYTDTTYSCSGVYADRDYAATFCPFVKEKCGDKEKVEFGEDSVN